MLFAILISYDFSRVDKCALSVPYTYNVDAIARRLSSCGRNNCEKARAIYRWITYHIAYDTKMKIYKWEEVLKSRSGICSGYSALFMEIAKRMGLKVVELISDNHSWVAVHTDNRWIIIDPTWGASYVNGKKFFRRFNNYYFDFKPEQMLFIKSHFPISVRIHTKNYPYFLDVPIERNSLELKRLIDEGKIPDVISWRTWNGRFLTKRMVKYLPRVYEEFFVRGFELVSVVKTLQGYDVIFWGNYGEGLCIKIGKLSTCSYVSDSLPASFPAFIEVKKVKSNRALYVLHINTKEFNDTLFLVHEINKRNRTYFHHIMKVAPYKSLLEINFSNFSFPSVSESFYLHKGNLLEPKQGKLLSNMEYDFKLFLKADSVYAQIGSNKHPFVKKDGIWTARIKVHGKVLRIFACWNGICENIVSYKVGDGFGM